MGIKAGVDTSSFDAQFMKLVKKHPVISKESLFKVMGKIKRDADDLPPRTPHDKGDLRGDVNSEIDVTITKTEFVGSVAYLQPYATYQHEGARADGTRKILNYVEPGTGSGFLSKKLFMYNIKYRLMLSNLIKKGIMIGGKK